MLLQSAARGISFIEVIIVMALIALVANYTFVVSVGAYRATLRHMSRSSLVTALQHARAESITGHCEAQLCATGMPHGVFIQHGTYVVFEGGSYALRDTAADEVISADPATTARGLFEIVFAANTGDVEETGDIVLSDPTGFTSTTTIGSEGQISWSN
ncbi:MAG TPA: hypothetical protein VMU13_00070 [Candidatus Paceibacterota bacterium]|nr:hypothetical protein [Candidatus Paceibacterota bacterium]